MDLSLGVATIRSPLAPEAEIAQKRAMKTSTKPLENSQVLLHVEVEPEEFDKALERAAREIAGSVKIPGFRKGKVPRRVLEARVGVEAITEEAVRQSLPGYLAEAVTTEEIDVIGRPSIDNLEAEGQSGLSFDATCDVRPEIEIKNWAGVEVEVPSLEVTDEDIDEQIDAFRRQSAPVEEVNRPAADGDFVLIDLNGHIHDEEVPGANLTDFLYEVGSAMVLEALDDEVTAKRAGDILKFNAALPESFGELAGQEAAFSVIVKEVRERRIPELDDDWVDDNTEFDTVEEFKGDVRDRLEHMRRSSVATAAREGTLSAIADLMTDPAPEALIEEESHHILEMMNMRLQMQGLDLGMYLKATGTSLEGVIAEQREPAERNVKADLALRAIARQEGLEVTEEDREKHVSAMAERSEHSAEEIRESIDKTRGWSAIEADIIRHKALDLAIEKAALKDDQGNSVDWSAVIREDDKDAEEPEA